MTLALSHISGLIAPKRVLHTELVQGTAVANLILDYVTVSTDGRVQHVLIILGAAHMTLIVKT